MTNIHLTLFGGGNIFDVTLCFCQTTLVHENDSAFKIYFNFTLERFFPQPTIKLQIFIKYMANEPTNSQSCQKPLH